MDIGKFQQCPYVPGPVGAAGMHELGAFSPEAGIESLYGEELTAPAGYGRHGHRSARPIPDRAALERLPVKAVAGTVRVGSEEEVG